MVQMYRKTDQFHRMMHLRLKSPIGRLREFYGGERSKEIKRLLKNILYYGEGSPLRKRPGLSQSNSFNQSCSNNLFKKTSLKKTNCE